MKLLVIKNKKIIQTLELDPDIDFKQEFLVGRANHCHIILNEAGMSREHGKFVLKNKNLSYNTIDTSSTNGGVNYEKLVNNQIIKFHEIEIKVVMDDENGRDLVKNQNLNVDQTVLNQHVEKLNIHKEAEEKIENIFQNEQHNDVQNDLMLGSEMLAETMKLSRETPDEPLQNSTTENENKVEKDIFGNFQNEDSVDNQKNNDLMNLPAEVLDEDATRVLTDFVKYSVVLSGTSLPFEKYVITKGETTIGRNSKNDIALMDQEVSSQHAKLILKNNILYIEDLGSVNGVFVNGQKVNRHQLVEGDVFTICSVGFTVKVESDFIESEKNILMPVEINEDHTQEFNLNDSFASANNSQEAPSSKSKNTFSPLQDLLNKLPLGELKNNPKRLGLYAVVAILLIVLLLPEGEENQKTDDSVIAVVKPTEISTKATDNSSPSQAESTTVEEKKSPEELNYLKSHYALAMSYLDKGDYASAISEIDLVINTDAGYKDITSLQGLAKDGLAKIEEQERKRKEEEERLTRKKEVDALLEKLEVAMNEKNLTTAEVLMSQIFEIDPENIKVSTLKIQLDSIKEDIRRKAEEEALKKELRKKMVASLSPAKNFFLQKEWYKAIIKLQDFLDLPGMDEDLITDASSMLQTSKKNLEEEISVPLNNARQYKSAQDFKNAYEQYNEVLKINPGNEEANIAAREIKDNLMNRARVIYREALVSESISQFRKAKEKFQEVLLVAPSDSEYYKRAEDKLKKIYLE